MDKNLKAELINSELPLDDVQNFMIKEKLGNLELKGLEEIFITFGENPIDFNTSFKFPIDEYNDAKYSYIKDLAEVYYRITYDSENEKDYTIINLCSNEDRLIEQMKFYHTDEFLSEFKSNAIKK